MDGELEAQQKLVHLLRQERNDAISSLAQAKAELEVAREDLDQVIRKRRNSPSPSRPPLSQPQSFDTNTPRPAPTSATHQLPSSYTLSGAPSRGAATALQHRGGDLSPRVPPHIEDAVNQLLEQARARVAGRNTSPGPFLAVSSPAHGGSTRTSVGPSSPGPGQQMYSTAAHPPPLAGANDFVHSPRPRGSSQTDRRIDDEVTQHLELTHHQIGELERRVERYETEVQTAIARNEQLQLRLDASLVREQTLTEQLAMRDEELQDARQQLSETCTDLETLKIETTRLMNRLNVQLERDAELDSKNQHLDIECRQLRDEMARLRGSQEAHLARIDQLELEVAALRTTGERREEDYRQKVVLLSRELASVREQRDQALRPYHARHAASAAHPHDTSVSSRRTEGAAAVTPSSATFGNSRTTTAPLSGPHLSSLTSPPPVNGHNSGGDDVMELKRQVQWLLERAGGRRP